MAHSNQDAAARAVKNSERKVVKETRTPDEIIKGIRGNLKAHLSVTPSDIAFLLGVFDTVIAERDDTRGRFILADELNEREIKRLLVENETLKAQIADMRAEGIAEPIVIRDFTEFPNLIDAVNDPAHAFVDHGGEA